MKFHIYKDDKGEWRWRLKAINGKILADSGEGYSTRLCLTSRVWEMSLEREKFKP